MIKYIKMMHIKDNVEIIININENIVSIKDKEDKQLFFKIISKGNYEKINQVISTILNDYSSNGYIISTMNIFRI